MGHQFCPSCGRYDDEKPPHRWDCIAALMDRVAKLERDVRELRRPKPEDPSHD